MREHVDALQDHLVDVAAPFLATLGVDRDRHQRTLAEALHQDMGGQAALSVGRQCKQRLAEAVPEAGVQRAAVVAKLLHKLAGFKE